MRPSPGIKARSDHNRRTESNGAAYEKPRRWRSKYDEGVICRNVDVCRIDGQDFNIAT
jgi:hypothetical protein